MHPSLLGPLSLMKDTLQYSPGMIYAFSQLAQRYNSPLTNLPTYLPDSARTIHTSARGHESHPSILGPRFRWTTSRQVSASGLRMKPCTDLTGYTWYYLARLEGELRIGNRMRLYRRTVINYFQHGSYNYARDVSLSSSVGSFAVSIHSNEIIPY